MNTKCLELLQFTFLTSARAKFARLVCRECYVSRIDNLVWLFEPLRPIGETMTPVFRTYIYVKALYIFEASVFLEIMRD
jgi:hypothetical protein